VPLGAVVIVVTAAVVYLVNVSELQLLVIFTDEPEQIAVLLNVGVLGNTSTVIETEYEFTHKGSPLALSPTYKIQLPYGEMPSKLFKLPEGKKVPETGIPEGEVPYV
jgi:hypothetical protein